MTDDMDLVQAYVARKSEQAFETLVARHVNLVYSTALRQTRDPHLAEEITQAVFIILARKADSLGARTILPAWLYRTAIFASADALKSKRRRAQRELAAHLQSETLSAETDSAWNLISPLLDKALIQLGETDRQAVLLHFFQQKTFAEIGGSLGLSEDSARKRTRRALEKLRKIFSKNGFHSPTSILAGAISTCSVQAAPAALAKSVTVVALAKGATASTSTLTLIKGALKIMAWTKAKTAIVTGAAVILAIGVATSTIAVHHQHTAASNAKLTEAGSGAYGLYIHFGSATFANPGEKGTIPASRFAPAAPNVQSWAHAAKQAGMTFAVLTAKHESGFCLWDSQDYTYDVGSSPFTGDLIGDFIAACKAEGVAPGVHYSIPDEFNEGAVRYNGAVSPTYFELIKKQVTELHTLYPDLRMHIFDVSERLSQEQFDELRGIVKQLNPQCIVWGTASGQSPNHESDTVISTWMWTPNARLNKAQSLSQHHQRSQAAKKAFVLNVGPDRAGEIPKDQLAVLMQVK